LRPRLGTTIDDRISPVGHAGHTVAVEPVKVEQENQCRDHNADRVLPRVADRSNASITHDGLRKTALPPTI
jgi:hypothetical protein